MGDECDVEIVPLFLVDLASAASVTLVKEGRNFISSHTKTFKGALEILVVGETVLVLVR